jgi:hypothetical protein
MHELRKRGKNVGRKPCNPKSVLYCTEMDHLPVFEMFTELKGLMKTSGGRCCIMNAAAHFSVVVLGVRGGERRF